MMYLHAVWRRLRSTRPTADRHSTVPDEASALRLELDEQRREVAALRARLDRGERDRDAQVDSELRRRLTKTFEVAATPAAQLLTQAHLHRQGRPVGAGDVIMISQRLISGLETVGLRAEGVIGESARFDPDRHVSLASDSTLRPGDHVVIKSVGMNFDGRVMAKAGVQRVSET
jgi:hypothetical protein